MGRIAVTVYMTVFTGLCFNTRNCEGHIDGDLGPADELQQDLENLSSGIMHTSRNPENNPRTLDQSDVVSKPNILIFMADDLGHADVGYSEGNLQTPTPNIDKFAWDGIILNRHYVNPICSPTRGAFMTGKDAYQIGMQIGTIGVTNPWGLPLQFKIQPQYFRDLGYTTALIGKWHLGVHTRQFYPSGRGFDYSYWFQSGDMDWFNYTTGWLTPMTGIGRDLRENGQAVPFNHTNNFYFPELMTAQAEKFIHHADGTRPWYLYFSTPTPHTAVENGKSVQQTMAQYLLRPAIRELPDRFTERKKQLAVIQAMDEQFRRIVNALAASSQLKNTIVVFLSDNGGALPETAAFTHGSNYASNWPLRLGKSSLFEGGVRCLSFVWSYRLPRRARITNQLFHVSDWLPTLYEAAGGDGVKLGDISGVSHWESLLRGRSIGPRTEVVLNIATTWRYAMIYQDREGRLWKILSGNVLNNAFFGWRRTDGTTSINPLRNWTPASVTCNFPEGVEIALCRPNVAVCLFELTSDPCETNNLADTYPDVVRFLNDKIARYNASWYPPHLKDADPNSNPNLYGGVWVPWMDDAEILDKEPLPFLPFTPSSSV